MLSAFVEILTKPKIAIPLILIIVIIGAFVVLTKPVMQVPIPADTFDADAYCAEQSIVYGVELVYNAQLNACVEVAPAEQGTADVPADAVDKIAYCQSIGMTYSQPLDKCIAAGQVPPDTTGQDYCDEQSAITGIPLQFIPERNTCEPTLAYKEQFCSQQGLVYDVGLDNCVDPAPQPALSCPPHSHLNPLCTANCEDITVQGVGSIVCECDLGYVLQNHQCVQVSVQPPPLPPPTDWLSGATAALAGAGNWLNQSIFQPIATVPTVLAIGASEFIGNTSSWLNQNVVQPSIQTVTNLPSVIVDNLSGASDWISQTVVQPVVNLSSTIINTVSGTSDWLNQNIVQPVTQLPSVIVDATSDWANVTLQTAAITTQVLVDTVQNTINTASNWLCQTSGWCF